MMKTIIFDFDGTIADSFATVVTTIHEMVHKRTLVTNEEIIKLRRTGLKGIVEQEKIPVWRLPFVLTLSRRLMSRRMNEVKLATGIDRVIKQLHASGYRLLIMSSNSRANIRRFLEAYDLVPYFSHIYGGVGIFGKSRLLKRILKINQLSPSECVYIGDELRDIQAAQMVGVPCIGVSWGFTDAELLAKHHPLAIADKPDQLLKLLKRQSS